MLDVSQIELKKQVNLVKSKPKLSITKSKTVIRIKSKTVASETSDADDADSVGYMMQRCAGFWRRCAVLTVIVTAVEMHWVVAVAVNADAAVE